MSELKNGAFSMPPGFRCGNCAWFAPKDASQREGECRANPPEGTVIAQAQPDILSAGQVAAPRLLCYWPTVGADRFCRLFFPRAQMFQPISQEAN